MMKKKKWYKKLIEQLKTIKKWLPIISKDKDYDYDFLLDILEFKLNNMREFHLEHGTSENSEEIAEQLRVAANLVFRIKNVSVYENFKYHEIAKTRSLSKAIDYADECRQQDINQLFNIISKNLTKWWD